MRMFTLIVLLLLLSQLSACVGLMLGAADVVFIEQAATQQTDAGMLDSAEFRSIHHSQNGTYNNTQNNGEESQ